MLFIFLALGAAVYGALGVFFAELLVGIESDWRRNDGLYIFVFFLWPIAVVCVFVGLLIWYLAITYPLKLARYLRKLIKEAFKPTEKEN